LWKKTGKKISIQGTDVAGFDKSKVECFNCHKMCHFARECKASRSQDRGRRDNYRQGSKVEEQAPKALMEIDGANNSPTKSKTYKVETAKKLPVKYAEQYRKPTKKPNARGNQRNWNNLKSHQLGPNFVMKKRACFNCGDFNHLTYDCRKKVKNGISRSQNNTHKSFTPRPAVHKPYRPPMRPMRSNMNVARQNRTSFNKPAHSYTKDLFKEHQQKIPIGSTKFSTADMAKKENTVKASACWFWKPSQNLSNKGPNSNSVSVMFKKYTYIDTQGRLNSQNNIDDKGYWDSGCFRHMTGNISYLSDYEPFDGGYVSFGQGGYKIIGKGTIKTGKLEFENVYFVKDLKDFKLLDDANVLLRTPRQHNMYSIDLNNIVPHKDLTCLVAKASVNECMLWHMRLGHLNFNTMNRLVRHNLVRGLPSKCFKNDHTCTACLKGKQNKASCKSKLVNSMTKPLHTLHMDLFGPTSISSISHKWYCLVVTDDFSRFTWTFFLKAKDEATDILRKFITEIENLKDLKGKIIRYDNGGEFRNKEMNDFCSQKGVKREFSNARTPQQNGVAKRRNRTLIEAARTMLVDAKLHVTFWDKAVNTAYNLGKFEAKGDEGYFISKAFRVFNKRTKRIEENLHVEFLKNKAIEKGAGPNWLFDIDSLTKSMNYVPVVAGTNSTNFLGTKDTASQEVKKDVSSLRYIALSNWVYDAILEPSSSKPQDDCSTDVPESSGNSNPTATSTNPPADQLETLTVETPIPTVSSPVPTASLNDSPELSIDSDGVEADVSNMETTITASPTPTLIIHKDHPKIQIISLVDTPIQSRNNSKEEEGIDYDKVFAPIARIEAIKLFLAHASFMGFTVYQMAMKSTFLYGTINEKVYVMQPTGF
nr:hypothetical protein [Tanacetum cinerariifolium]